MLWGLWCLKLMAGFLDYTDIVYDHGFILMSCFLKLYISSDVKSNMDYLVSTCKVFSVICHHLKEKWSANTYFGEWKIFSHAAQNQLVDCMLSVAQPCLKSKTSGIYLIIQNDF